MKRFPLVTTLFAAVALTLAWGAFAQATTPDPVKQKELEAAREDLHRAAERVARLSREIGGEEAMVIERRMHRRPMLGVILEPDTGSGVRIAAVTPDSAAAKAGLRSGDRLVSIDGKALGGKDGEERLHDARARLRSLDGARPVTLGYVRDGRAASVKATPQVGEPLWMMIDGEGNRFSPRGRVVIKDGKPGAWEVNADSIVVDAASIGPEIHREIVRLDRNSRCADARCDFPLLREAFRWNGLNLASVDKQLGRYFGTDHGVLVLSVPEKMGGLQPGDVLQKVDGKNVTTPREAMDAAHARAPGTAVPVEYLRDRKVASTRITLPERPWLLPLAPPPAPPTPPLPPTPPTAPDAMSPADHALPPAPPTPPVDRAPPAPPAPAPTPPAPPASPEAPVAPFAVL